MVSGPRKRSPAVRRAAAAAQTASAGAIFQVGSGYSGLVTGTRARSLGDMVTIILTENTITTKSTAGQTKPFRQLRTHAADRQPHSISSTPMPLKLGRRDDSSGGGNAAQQSRLNGAVA